MTINERYNDANDELHFHAVLSGREIHDAHYRVHEAILERIVHVMVKELLPVLQSRIVIDWTRVNREVEDALIRRMTDVVIPPAPERR